ncbi:uncharacterized protein LOC131849592 [Achroia grisella]|uniref:uncharacterized protein LOC131849592 n=1 Tax=Achroia grisella TaxID=688607 RepID=UPI0027D2C4F6|nr:uncharacterized protein LOC131849592 [Achroia grisella]
MDSETKKITTTAASMNAPKNLLPRGASQDAPMRTPLNAAFSNVLRSPRFIPPKHAPNMAASEDMRMATDRHAPTQAASHYVQSSSSKDALRMANPFNMIRTAPTGKPRNDAFCDATTHASPNVVSSEVNSAELTDGEPMGSFSEAASYTVTNKATMNTSFSKTDTTWNTNFMSVSKKRRLKAKAKAKAKAAVKRAEAVVAAKQSADLGSCSTETKLEGEATVSWTRAIEPPIEAIDAPSVGLHKTIIKPRGCKNPSNNNPKQQTTRPQKRTHPEDIVSSTECKKLRTGIVRAARTSTTNAEAGGNYLNNELCVAVMIEPFTDMTQEQAEGIRKHIEEKLRDQILAKPETTHEAVPNNLRFRGKTHFGDGVLKTWCEDEFTLTWLNEIIQNISSPVANSKLVIRPQSAIPKKIPCLLFVPGYTGDIVTLRKLLAGQNSNLHIDSWTLTYGKIRTEPPGTCLFFRIPVTIVNLLKAQDRRIYYLMGNIYVRFMDRKASQQTNKTSTQQKQNGQGNANTKSKPTTLATDSATVEERVEPVTRMEVLEPYSPVNRSDEEYYPAGGESEQVSFDDILYSTNEQEH